MFFKLLFISFVLFCGFQTNLAFTDVRDDATWFRAGGDSIRKKFVSGAVNGIIDKNCEDEASNGYMQGECMSAAECLKENGKKGNICSLLGVCCVIEKTCSETTSSKISYFVNPAKSFQHDCPLRIKIYSKDVCQIRLDFEEFDIYQPTNTIEPTKDNENVTNGKAFKCYVDKFKVEKAGKNLGFSSLCGRNSGQHIYIPVQQAQNEIFLRFLLRNRSSDVSWQNPKWRIKIHQLECFDKNNHIDGQTLDAHTKLLTLYQNLKQKKKSYKSDYELIAPPNCLQYYPERTGTFESFNYNDGKGCYIGGLDYSICFRKYSDVCSVGYNAVNKFQMNFNPYNADKNLDYCHPAEEAGPCISQDYIRINGGKLEGSAYKDYYCNQLLSNGGRVTSRSNEPFFIKVHTDDYRAYELYEECGINAEEVSDHEEIGFRMNYELEGCGEDN